MNQVNIAKLNVRHLGCSMGFFPYSTQNPQLKILPIAFLERICQIFDSPIIPCIWYFTIIVKMQLSQ